MQVTFQSLCTFPEGRPAHQSLTAHAKKKWTLSLKLKAKPRKDLRNRATRAWPWGLDTLVGLTSFPRSELLASSLSFVSSSYINKNISSCLLWTAHHVPGTLLSTFLVSLEKVLFLSLTALPSPVPGSVLLPPAFPSC